MNQRSVGLLFLLMCALGWGSNWPVLKLLLAELPPMSTRGWAGLLASAAFMLGARLSGIPLAVPRALRGRLVLYALLNITAWMGLATAALLFLSASEAVILATTTPVMAAILAWALHGERPEGRRVAGMALAIASVALLLAGRGVAAGIEKLPGLALMLSATALFALATVLAKRRPLPLHPVAAAAWQLGIGMLPLWLFSVLFENPDWAALGARDWAHLLWMAAVPLGLAYLGWFGALHRLPATVATSGTLLVPVVGVLGGAAMLGDPLGWREVLALCGTIAGVALALRPGQKRA